MSYTEFIERIENLFGENAIVRDDRENGRYLAKHGEWRISLNHSGKKARLYNVRSKENFVEEF